MTVPEASAVTVALERLRTELGAELGAIKTSCAVLVERSDRTTRDVQDLDARSARELRDVRARLAAVERRVWAASGAAAAIGGAAGWILQALGS